MNVKATVIEPGWKWALTLVAIAAIAFAGFWVISAGFKSKDGSPTAAVSSGAPAANANVGGPYPDAVQSAEDGDATESSPSAKQGDTGTTRDSKAGTEAATTADKMGGRSAPVRPSRSMLADELLAGLSDLNLRLDDGLLTADDVQEIRQTLEELGALGDAAVPAVRDFLRQGADLTLDERIDAETRRETGTLDYATLRLALFDVLHQVGGPEAESAMYDAFRSTRVPSELGALTDYLEAESPGDYRQEALDVARDMLDSAWSGQMEGQDVGGLFHVLETYGDAEAVAELEKNLDERWGQYAIIALGGIAEGAGIPVVSRLVEDADLGESERPVYTDRGKLALQTLAQVAGRDFGASHALIEKARANEIPADMWPVLASVLAGDDQLQIKKPEIDQTTAEPYSTSKAYKYPYNTHRVGPYVLYSVHRSAQLSQEEVATRLDLITRLLGATDDPTAKAALQRSQKLLMDEGG